MAKKRGPITVGVVGLGRAGWDIHVDQLRDHKAFHIVALADPDKKRLREGSDELGCASFPDLKSLLRGSDAELVVVATPSRSHAPDSTAAMKAGRHVVVEKPMAMNLAQASRMIQSSRRCRRKLFVHQQYRFNQITVHLQQVIASGILGRVFHVRANWVSFNRRNDWQTLRRNGGGVLNNTCPHAIDMAMQLLGAKVTAVMGDLQQIKDAGDAEDHVKIFMRGANGCTVDLEVSTCCAATLPTWMILGSCGTLVTNGEDTTVNYYDPRKVPKLKVVDGPAPGRRYGIAGDKLPWRQKQFKVSKTKVVSGFYDNVAGVLRKNAKMAITPESVREVIRVIAMARKGTKFN